MSNRKIFIFKQISWTWSLCNSCIWFSCHWSLIKVAALWKIIICVSSCLWVLKLLHFKQWRVILFLHLEEVFTVRVIMRHSTSSCMSSCKLSNRWWFLGTQHTILLIDLSICDLSIVVADNVSHRRTWPISFSIRMCLLRNVNRLLSDRQVKPWELILILSSIRCLSPSSCSLGFQRYSIGQTEVIFISWNLAVCVSSPYRSYWNQIEESVSADLEKINEYNDNLQFLTPSGSLAPGRP